MLITKVIDNIGTEEVAGKKIEWVELDWEELSKRILRTATDQGTDVALRLDQEEPLQYGDVLFEDEDRRIVIRTKMEPVIVITPKDMTEMGKAAFELGNRHTPSLIDNNEIIVRADHTLNKLLDEVGVAYETTERRFKQPFKYRGTPTDLALLQLFQIHDSAFPIGSYTQSYGMETYIQEELIQTKDELIDFCTSFLFHNLVRSDAILIQEAYAAALEQDVDKLLELEQLCGAMKLAKESREASVNLGRQFIRTVSPLGTDEFLADWKERIESKSIKGHYAILYGIYSATTGVSVHHAVMMYLYASVNGLVQNAVRAVPFGQNTGVQAVNALIQPVTEAAALVATFTLDDITNNALGIELASMKHEYLFSRLFIS